MKVLDVGSGAGDVALIAAELVGPNGAVTAVDINPDVLEVARERAIRLGLSQVTFHAGDILKLDLERDFDAVVGRLVLMYPSNPAVFAGPGRGSCKTRRHHRLRRIRPQHSPEVASVFGLARPGHELGLGGFREKRRTDRYWP